MSDFSSLIISAVQVNVVEYPLKQTYELSFKKIVSFTSIQVTLECTNGESRTAEVVPLVGYNDESTDAILGFINLQKELIINQTLSSARHFIENNIPNQPFATSPILTSIDLFKFDFNNSVASNSIDFVVPTSTGSSQNFIKQVKELNAPRTIKIKLSSNVLNDISFFKEIENIDFSKVIELRLDANQAYSLNEANKMFAFLEQSSLKNKIIYIEQPLKTDEWGNTANLVSCFPNINVMLDECIITEQDIIKAKKIGVNFVKLKLFKQGGIAELIKLAKLGSKLNLKVILGNGVATSISNEIENLVYTEYKDLFYGASEANGFLKVALN